MKKAATNTRISYIIPVYNEADGLETFHNHLLAVLKDMRRPYEIIYINDGSSDDSAKILKTINESNDHARVLTFSRNFGKELATTAGLHHASGAAAMILDADGQHPVELIPRFISTWEEGAEVVIGVRTANQREGFVKRHGSKLFYKILRFIGAPDVLPGSTDFRLVDRQVINSFKQLKEHRRVTRSLIDWLGYDREIIEFKAKPREHGTATYSFRKLLSLAVNGFVSLSFAPLYFAGYLGVFMTLLSMVAALFAVIETYVLDDPLTLNISGTAILGILIMFMVGILLVCQGLLAIYVARIYSDAQDRPLYVIKDDN